MKEFMKNLWTKIKVWFKGIFMGLYTKPLIKISDLEEGLSKIDKDGDGSLSANEIWEFIISKIKNK